MGDVKSLGILAVAAVVFVFGSACADDPDVPAPTRTQPTERSPEPTTVPEDDDAGQAKSTGKAVTAEIIDTDFRPLALTIEAGDTVKWTQVGDQPHSVTAADSSFDSSPNCGPLESDKCLGMGDTFSFKFEEPGTYRYYCRVHGLPDGTGMVAKVTVR
jgi:plastocyanin